MIRIDVDVKVPGYLTPEALAAAPRKVRDEVRSTLMGDVLLIEGAIAQRTPVNRGTLRGATATDVKGELHDLTGRVYNPTIYGAAVDLGAQAHTPPFEPILRWARLVIGGANVHRAARAIWASIRRKGTKAQPFWGAGWKSVQPEIERRHVAMLGRVAKILGGGA